MRKRQPKWNMSKRPEWVLHKRRNTKDTQSHQRPEECKFKPLRRYHYISIWLTKTKNPVITSVGENTEQKELSYTFHGNANWYNHFGK